MNKLTEQNLLKKSRFLKYSLLASISVGAIIAIPFEGMASSDQKALFRDALEKKLSFRLSQSNGNRDTTNTPQQIGTVMVPEPERNTYTSSEIREMEISKQSKAFKPSNPLKDIPIEDHYKKVARSKSDVGKARKVRPPTRSKTFVGAEKVEQNQNNYTPEPTEQTPQKPEIIITASSPTVSPASNGFVTAPNTPNTTLTSPEHYTTVPGTPSTLATSYQPTPDSKPNDNLGAKTPPNTNSKAVRRLSFSSEPQQTVQPSTQAKPPVPPKPLLLSSAEVAAKMVSNILRVNETLGIKLAEVESTIKNTQGKKNKKPLQQLQKQIVSSQKKTKVLKLEAAKIGIKIKELDEENRSLASCNKKTGGVKNKRELDKDSAKLKENNKKIDELQQKLTNKNEEANSLSREIDVSVGGIVLTKPQRKAPVTEMPLVGLFLNQQQQLEVLTQRQKVNATRQAVVDKRRAEANEVKRNSAEYKDLISEREEVQLEQNQRHIAVEKAKKQQQAEDKQRTEREKKRKEENHQKEKARDIVGIREDIAKKMQQISNANTTSNRLQELELKVGAIEDKKQRQEAQKQLSKIKKQEKAIKAAAYEAQKILNDAKKEASRTKLKKLQEQMDNHVAMVTNDKIEENIKKLEGLALTPSTTSSAATISKQSLTAKSTMQLSHELQRTLPEDEDGYLEPIKVQQQPYTVMLSNQEVADPKSMNSGLGSLPSGISGKETDEDTEFNLGWGNVPHMQTANVNSSLESNPMLAILQQQIQENRSKTYGQLPSHPKDIYEAKVSQYINYLNSIQPNQSNQAQIDGVIDSLATEMRKLSVDQFNQKLDEIAHLVGIKTYEGLVSKVYEIQQANLLQTTTTDESSRSNKNWKNPALYSLSSELDKKGLEYLDLAGDAFAQKSKQPDTLTIETLGLITQTQNPTVAKSDSLKKSNVSGSIPEIQQPQSEKMRTETLDVQNDLGLDLHSQEEQLKSMDSGCKSLEGQNLSSAYDFEQLSASWDAAYNQRMNTKAENVPQETLTEESTYSVSSKKKQGNIIKRAVSKVGSILQTNDAENRKRKRVEETYHAESSKRKRDGEPSKQRTVDKEGGFGQGSGNGHHKEAILSVDSKLIEKAAQLISDLDVKRSEILQTTSPSQQKSLNLALQGIENDYQEAIEVYNAKAEKKLDAIKSRADKHFNNIETDADVGFNPNWGNGHSMPTANMNSLPKNLAVTPPINVGSLYNSPQAQQFREDHKTTIINAINSLSSSGVPKESIDPTIIKSLPYLDNDQYQEVVLRVDRVHDINTRGYLLSKLKQLGELEVRELTGVYASLYNTAPPEVLREAEALLDRSQGRLNLVDSTIKGTQPLSNLSTIYEPVSYENLASETIYNREQPKPSISCRNTGKRKLVRTPLFSAELDKKLDYLDLEDKLLKVEEDRRVKEKQAIAILNQYQDPENLEFKRLAIEVLDLSSKESQLKEKRKAIEAAFPLNEGYSSTDVSSSRYSVGDISDLLSDTELNLSRSPSINGLEDLSGSNVMKLGKLKSEHEKIANDYKAKELELDTLNHDDPKFKKLMLEVFEMSKEKIWLEGEIKHLNTESKPKVTESKPVFSRSSSASSLNIFGSNEDLSWDNTRDIGVGHRYGAEDSCPTPDQSSSKIANSSDKNSSETKLALLRTYQMAVIVKRQELEQLPSTSSEAAQIVQQIEVLREEEELVNKVLSRAEKDPLAFDQAFSFEEINKELKKYDAEIPVSLDPQYNSDEDIAILVSSLDEEVEKFNREIDKMSASDGKSESTLPAGNEEQEDTEVTESGIQKAGDKGLLALPVSSNECALALSDGREKECLALGDGSEDEESYDSGFEEEEEIIEQLSDSDGDNLKITEVDTAIPFEQKAKKEMQTQISENAPTLNQAKVVNTIVNNMIRNRLDASMNMSNNMVAVGAGDEEESRIKRGLWMRGMYGTNNHGRVENMTGYRGTNKGATIGFDVEIDNNILGIAYSNIYSVFKFKNSKNNDKELIDSHVVSIYGQKELPRNFALQALVSASKNFIKDKTTYSYGDTKIRSNVKHRNHSYNAEALLNYNYLLQNKLVITPNIGLRYGKSRDGVYNETGINVQEIALTMKENNILSGIVGTKVKVPLKDALKFNNLGLTFQGAVEHNFKEKTQKINRVVKIFDNTFKQDYLIPKQPKTSYNLGTGIIGSIKNTTISLDYNYYLNKHYRSHQGSVKLKVNL
ncbi:MAG: autotransporter domain-containing protein [Rickettsia sp.]|uniref:autotransporter domain-containing protein n=1 Tax=Rickettsia sp. TaxID=789 RepID=UPI0039785425